MRFNIPIRPVIFLIFSLLAASSVYYIFQLKFNFTIDQFFPEGDEDLKFFQKFTEEFESDINFLLIAVERKEGVFEKSFLENFHDFTLNARNLPNIIESQSLTKLSYPIRTPFAITTVPVIDINDPGKYERNKQRILQDERFVHNLISEDATAIVVALKTIEDISLSQSQDLIQAVHALANQYPFDDYHILGPAYFQKEIVAMQKRELLVSSIVSIILIAIIIFWIFRRPWGIAIALVSIGLGMLLFLGGLGASGRELNAMSALYPVLMIIVGASDVIHIMSKYIDELRKGFTKKEAISTTIREIGLATLLTSMTTAIGFASLMTSRIGPIKDFGINSALGVMVAYVAVIFFTTSVLSYLPLDKLIKLGKSQAFWEKMMERIYLFTRRHPKRIVWGAILSTVIFLVGISRITTNYKLESNLPKGEKISGDFLFFESKFAGFRPLELAVFAQNDFEADDYEVLLEMHKVEEHLRTIPDIKAITSATAIYKSINRMNKANRSDAYEMPQDKVEFLRYKDLASKIPRNSTNVLISRDKKKARISSRVSDLGADSIQHLEEQIENWIEENTDSTIAQFKLTGTGLILDRNANYVRENLLQGLAMAILIVSVLMALLFQNAKMIFISLVPNLLPLLLAGAILGYLGIELEAGISIVFAVIFGIAVDDTIHFLSKYKLARLAGKPMEPALKVTFTETGKAIVLTSIVLFFGFLIMLFSINPPSVTVGLLISATLISALLADLLLIPVMIRKWLK